MSKTIEIKGNLYSIDDPRIAEDYFLKGKYILKSWATAIVTNIKLSKTKSYGYDFDYVYTNKPTHEIGQIVEELPRANIYEVGNIILLNDEVALKAGFKKGRYIKSFLCPKSINTDKIQVYKQFTNTWSNVDKKSLDVHKVGYVENGDYKTRFLTKEEKLEYLMKNVSMGTSSATYRGFEGKEYTFGVELETCFGRIYEEDWKDLNVKCVYDGSLRDDDRNDNGGEYVSGVLKGDAGLVQLHKICDTLANYCLVNNKCGIHVHVGNIKFSTEDVVYTYILGLILQKEIFKILPVSRSENDFCKLLPSIIDRRFPALNNKEAYDKYISDCYDEVFKLVSGGRKPDQKLTRKHNHPDGAKCGYNHKSQRYQWLNFVPLLFDTKGHPDSYTLEFRPHSGATDFYKIKRWLQLCIAFVYFVENHKDIIRKGHDDKEPITIKTILKYAYPKRWEKLHKYFEERKEFFSKDPVRAELQEYAEENKKALDKNVVVKNNSKLKDLVCV